MQSTQRSLNNLPTNLDTLIHLADVDVSWVQFIHIYYVDRSINNHTGHAVSLLTFEQLSKNALIKIPDGLLTLPNLKRLNLSENQLKEITPAIGKSLP